MREDPTVARLIALGLKATDADLDTAIDALTRLYNEWKKEQDAAAREGRKARRL